VTSRYKIYLTILFFFKFYKTEGTRTLNKIHYERIALPIMLQSLNILITLLILILFYN
jgi:hypothetical protein